MIAPTLYRTVSAATVLILVFGISMPLIGEACGLRPAAAHHACPEHHAGHGSSDHGSSDHGTSDAVGRSCHSETPEGAVPAGRLEHAGCLCHFEPAPIADHAATPLRAAELPAMGEMPRLGGDARVPAGQPGHGALSPSGPADVPPSPPAHLLFSVFLI